MRFRYEQLCRLEKWQDVTVIFTLSAETVACVRTHTATLRRSFYRP